MSEDALGRALDVLGSGQPRDRLEATQQLLSALSRDPGAARRLGENAIFVFLDNYGNTNVKVAENCILLTERVLSEAPELSRMAATRVLLAALEALASSRKSTRDAANSVIDTLLVARQFLDLAEASPVLLSGLSNRSPTVRANVIDAVEAIYLGAPYSQFQRFVSRLCALTADGNPEVRKAAVRALGAACDEYSESREEILETLRRSGASPQLLSDLESHGGQTPGRGSGANTVGSYGWVSERVSGRVPERASGRVRPSQPSDPGPRRRLLSPGPAEQGAQMRASPYEDADLDTSLRSARSATSQPGRRSPTPKERRPATVMTYVHSSQRQLLPSGMSGRTLGTRQRTPTQSMSSLTKALQNPEASLFPAPEPGDPLSQSGALSLVPPEAAMSYYVYRPLKTYPPVSGELSVEDLRAYSESAARATIRGGEAETLLEKFLAVQWNALASNADDDRVGNLIEPLLSEIGRRLISACAAGSAQSGGEDPGWEGQITCIKGLESLLLLLIARSRARRRFLSSQGFLTSAVAFSDFFVAKAKEVSLCVRSRRSTLSRDAAMLGELALGFFGPGMCRAALPLIDAGLGLLGQRGAWCESSGDALVRSALYACWGMGGEVGDEVRPLRGLAAKFLRSANAEKAPHLRARCLEYAILNVLLACAAGQREAKDASRVCPELGRTLARLCEDPSPRVRGVARAGIAVCVGLADAVWPMVACPAARAAGSAALSIGFPERAQKEASAAKASYRRLGKGESGLVEVPVLWEGFPGELLSAVYFEATMDVGDESLNTQRAERASLPASAPLGHRPTPPRQAASFPGNTSAQRLGGSISMSRSTSRPDFCPESFSSQTEDDLGVFDLGQGLTQHQSGRGTMASPEVPLPAGESHHALQPPEGEECLVEDVAPQSSRLSSLVPLLGEGAKAAKLETLAEMHEALVSLRSAREPEVRAQLPIIPSLLVNLLALYSDEDLEVRRAADGAALASLDVFPEADVISALSDMLRLGRGWESKTDADEALAMLPPPLSGNSLHASLRLLGRVLRRGTEDRGSSDALVFRALSPALPALRLALGSGDADLRCCATRTAAEAYLRLGPSLRPWLEGLDSRRLRLVGLVVEKLRERGRQ